MKYYGISWENLPEGKGKGELQNFNQWDRCKSPLQIIRLLQYKNNMKWSN